MTCFILVPIYSISQEICTRFLLCFALLWLCNRAIMNSHELFIHIHQGCFAGTVAIVRLPQCQWSKPDGYGKISQCITTTKHSKAKTVCMFLGIYCMQVLWVDRNVYQSSFHTSIHSSRNLGTGHFMNANYNGTILFPVDWFYIIENNRVEGTNTTFFVIAS